MNFEKEGVVSVWFSTVDFSTVPEAYFEADGEWPDQWSRGFKITQYDEELQELNGCESGTESAEALLAPCSYSASYADAVSKKIIKLGHDKICWLVLMFDFEYRAKKTQCFNDDYMQFAGAFPYSLTADSIIDPDS